MISEKTFVIALLIVMSLGYVLWPHQSLPFTKPSLRDFFQEEQINSAAEQDWLLFDFERWGDGLVTVGEYEKTGSSISVTYLGCDYSTYLLKYINRSLRPIPTRSKGGVEWLEKVRFKIYEDGDPMATTRKESLGRELSQHQLIVNIKKRRVRRIQYLRAGEVVTPTEYELDPNYGYSPKNDQYDTLRYVEEEVAEFPPMLKQRDYDEAEIEILGGDGQPLGAGRYFIRAELDLQDFDLNLFRRQMSSIPTFEVWAVKSIEDRVNYQIVRAEGFIQRKNLAAAEREFIAATAINPNSTRPWYQLGWFYDYQLIDYDKAISAYQRMKAVSERKGLKQKKRGRYVQSDVLQIDEGETRVVTRSNGMVLYGDPVYPPGLIEQVKKKKIR